jgi:UDP-N-acetylmuramoyl-L-alanyl-D-glutamate--2,6-diaminopimelate ligase
MSQIVSDGAAADLGGVRLDDLFPATRRSGAAGAVVQRCTSDWRQVRRGDAFVAIVGADDDGHTHVARAVRRGAAAIVAEQLVPASGAPVYVVDDTRTAYGELCHALAGHPSRQLRVIGVIGDQGKSTVIALLQSILARAGCQVGVLSSLASFDGMSYGVGSDAPLAPPVLASRLAHMDAAGCTHALVEMSSVALAQRMFAGIELDTVVATRVDAAHLDVHHNPQNYRDAQRRALNYLVPSGLAVVNADDPVTCRWLATLDAASLTYGLNGQAQITADIVERNPCETVTVLAAGSGSAAIRTTIVGDAHASNCVAAAAVALAHGVDLQTIAAGIEAVDRLAARMERIDCGQEFAVFVDAAKSPPALRATLRSARQLARGRVICVLGETPSAPVEATAVRSIVDKLADLTIVPGTAALDDDWRASGDDATGMQVVGDRAEAIAWAIAVAQRGDVIVIAGSRAPTEGGFGVRGIVDADIAREMLYARAQPELRLVG